jgi:hypothetical protein
MRAWPACVALALLPAWSQSPAPPVTAPAARTVPPCADCGIVRSVNKKEKQERPATAEGKPSGLVATVPLGGGKVQVGPSQKLGGDAVVTEKSWEVVVQLDDGKFRLVRLDRQPEVQQGDRVRVEGNQLVKLQSTSGPATPPEVPAPRK